MFKENNVEVPKEVAGLLFVSLISDTFLLKSPTTCFRSLLQLNLQKLLVLILEEYGLAMLSWYHLFFKTIC